MKRSIPRYWPATAWGWTAAAQTRWVRQSVLWAFESIGGDVLTSGCA